MIGAEESKTKISSLLLVGLFIATIGKAASVMDLQLQREVLYEADVIVGKGKAKVTLTNLNKNVNTWYLFTISGPAVTRGPSPVRYINFENPDPAKVKVYFDKTFPQGLVVDGKKYDLWSSPMEGALSTALTTGSNNNYSYIPICDGKLFVRNYVAPGGKDMTSLGSSMAPQFIIDRAKESAAEEDKIAGEEVDKPAAGAALPADQSKWPEPGKVVPGTKSIRQWNSKIKVDYVKDSTYVPGQWYPTTNYPGTYLSVVRPSQVVRAAGGAGTSQVAFLVGMDLDTLGMGWATGSLKDSEYEEGWGVYNGAHTPAPGPDGFSSAAPPLVKTGAINPFFGPKYIASFNGGFRRRDAFLKAGTLGKDVSVYGYIENGAVMTSLSNGLATAYVNADGKVDIKTWEEKDNTDILPVLRHARQNGLPLIDIDQNGQAVRGKYIFNLNGNWGGWWNRAMTSNFQTSRSGMCIQESGKKRFLIFGYFSSAYQWDLADVFIAYGCKAGMQLDMYKAKFSSFMLGKMNSGTAAEPYRGYQLEPLISDMDAYIKEDEVNGKTYRRPPHAGSFFRDFFYIYKKD